MDEIPTVDVLQRDGKAVYCNEWEGGMGAYGLYVYELDGVYYSYDMFAVENEDASGPDGPYDSLAEALRGTDHLIVSSATTRISCSELSFQELTRLLKVHETVDEDTEVDVNGEYWRPRGQGSRL